MYIRIYSICIASLAACKSLLDEVLYTLLCSQLHQSSSRFESDIQSSKIVCFQKTSIMTILEAFKNT